jgi:hypothetical protein
MSSNDTGTENKNFEENAILKQEKIQKAMSSLISHSTNVLLVKEITGETLYSRNRTYV